MCPVLLDQVTQVLLDFSIDASVLQIKDNAIRFSHQLLQEYLASRDASQSAHAFWPQSNWWACSGWEVVAEIAAESCGGICADISMYARIRPFAGAIDVAKFDRVVMNVIDMPFEPVLRSQIIF
jgi:hypothetical protein